MSIEIKDGAFTGGFGGKLVNGLATPSIPGSSPVPGLYHVAPPIEDVVFGLVAVMTPVRVGGGGVFASDDWTQLKNTSQIKFWQKNAKPDGTAAGAFVEMPSANAAYEFYGGRSAEHFEKFVGPGSNAGVFVLSSRPIPGRNCLVIQGRFADLMDALRSSGGAEVRVY